MPLICLEGASAVGKTTTCKDIEKCANAYIVPEVNMLFEKPEFPHQTWYLERQVERYQIAREKLKTFEIVILDGDIFQPLGYNWCFDFKIFDQSLDFITEFYKKEILEESIGFPDRYFYLYTDHENLINRKESDLFRRRRNFEKHLNITEPHRRYYESLNRIEPDYMHFIPAESVKKNIKAILENMPLSAIDSDPLSFLEKIVGWLKTHRAESLSDGQEQSGNDFK